VQRGFAFLPFQSDACAFATKWVSNTNHTHDAVSRQPEKPSALSAEKVSKNRAGLNQIKILGLAAFQFVFISRVFVAEWVFNTNHAYDALSL
jgi:hypothetical protein